MWLWRSAGILRTETLWTGLEGLERVGEVARVTGAEADMIEVGRMLAERGFASSFRRQLKVSAMGVLDGRSCAYASEQ